MKNNVESCEMFSLDFRVQESLRTVNLHCIQKLCPSPQVI